MIEITLTQEARESARAALIQRGRLQPGEAFYGPKFTGHTSFEVKNNFAMITVYDDNMEFQALYMYPCRDIARIKRA